MGKETLPPASAEQLAEKVQKLEEENRRLTAENKRLEELATIDPLTGVYNRRGLAEAVEKFFKPPQSNDKRQEGTFSRVRRSAVLIIDMDNFKIVNDAYGHATGDKALQDFVKFLQEHIRDEDVVGRWGGDEFVIVFANASAQNVIDATHRWGSPRGRGGRAKLGFETEIDGRIVELTIGGGVTERRQGESLEEAIARADQALKRSKKPGKGIINAEKELSEQVVGT